ARRRVPRLVGGRLRRREPRGLSQRAGRRPAAGGAARARAGAPALGTGRPGAGRSGRRRPRRVRSRQRARQPDPARLPHPAPAGRPACEDTHRAVHGVVTRDPGRPRRRCAGVPGLRLAGRRRGRSRRPARGHELRSRDHAPLPGSGARLMRTVLSYRDARLLLAGQTLSAFGDWAMLIVLAVWMKALTGSSALAGLTFFTFAAGSLLAPLGGLLADRVRRRPLMIVSDCVLGGGAVAVLDSATFAASAFFLWRMRVREEKPAPAEHHFTQEVTAGLRHVWETLPLRQIVLGVALTLLVVGFSETLIFSVIAALGRQPSFFGVFAT